jgi:hypothetical protein
VIVQPRTLSSVDGVECPERSEAAGCVRMREEDLFEWRGGGLLESAFLKDAASVPDEPIVLMKLQFDECG